MLEIVSFIIHISFAAPDDSSIVIPAPPDVWLVEDIENDTSAHIARVYLFRISHSAAQWNKVCTVEAFTNATDWVTLEGKYSTAQGRKR